MKIKKDKIHFEFTTKNRIKDLWIIIFIIAIIISLITGLTIEHFNEVNNIQIPVNSNLLSTLSPFIFILFIALIILYFNTKDSKKPIIYKATDEKLIVSVNNVKKTYDWSGFKEVKKFTTKNIACLHLKSRGFIQPSVKIIGVKNIDEIFEKSRELINKNQKRYKKFKRENIKINFSISNLFAPITVAIFSSIVLSTQKLFSIDSERDAIYIIFLFILITQIFKHLPYIKK